MGCYLIGGNITGQGMIPYVKISREERIILFHLRLIFKKPEIENLSNYFPAFEIHFIF